MPGGQEVGPPRQVGDRAPHLPGRRHRAGVLVRLLGERLVEVVDAVPLRVRRLREVRRARHAQGLEQLARHHVPPRRAPQPGDRLAEQREAEVAVVVVLPRAGHRAAAVVGREQQRPARRPASAPTTSRPARSACRTTCASRSRTVASAYPVSGTNLPDRVGQREQSLVAQPHHRDRDEGLGDRADPVLRVVGRTGHVAGAADPAQRPVGQHAGDDRRQPAATLEPLEPGRARSLTRRTPRSAGTSRRGCGRRTPGRCARPEASTCRGPDRPGRRRARARTAAPTSR